VVTIDVSEPRLGLVRGLLLVIWPHKAGTPKNQSAAFFFQKKGQTWQGGLPVWDRKHGDDGEGLIRTAVSGALNENFGELGIQREF